MAFADSLLYVVLHSPVLLCSVLLPVQVELSPLENAIEFVKDGITALKNQIRRLKKDTTASSNQLTMKLQGILDAAVSGGLKNYEVHTYIRAVYSTCMWSMHCVLLQGYINSRRV